jgi:hypothetical protein
MKNLYPRISILVFFSLFSCDQSSFEKEAQNKPNPNLNIAPSSNQVINDISRISNSKNFISYGALGCLEVRSFQIIIGPSKRNSGSLVLPADYVIIGGGASISCPPSGCGAYLYPSSFLITSRPDFASNSWVADSKEHLNPDPHYLKIYAIGVKITNVSSTQLRSYMQVFSKTSIVQAGPSTSVTVPADYDMLGGGAQINYGNGAGSLLVSSYPSSPNTWSVHGKDHMVSSPASITAYAIGIKKIVNFAYCPTCTPRGLFNVAIVSASGSTIGGRAVVRVSLPSSTNPNLPWMAACPGARTTYNGSGIMLQTCVIDDEFIESTAGAKDLNVVDSGSLSSFFVVIQPTDCWCC